MIDMLATFLGVVFFQTGAAYAPPADGFVLEPVEARLIELTNAERTERGLPPLEVDPELMKSARKHCTWMVRSGSFRHTSAAVAENIAMGQRSASAAVRSWMNSSGHRANMLSRRHGKIGVAGYVNDDGTAYWCQQFEP